MTGEKQEPAEPQGQQPAEKTRKGMIVPTPKREDFFANLEQVSKPEDKPNGDEAGGSNPDPSI